jgi:hypothetical protein
MNYILNAIRFLRTPSAPGLGRTVLVAVAFCVFVGKINADGLVLQPVDKNLDDERALLIAFFDDLAKTPASGEAPNYSGSYGSNDAPGYAPAPQPIQEAELERRHHRHARRGLDWASAGSTPYKKDATLDAMTALCATAAQSVGSACQAQEAAELESYGAQLASNSDPELQQTGSLMQSESSAVNSGDQASAQSYASSVQDEPQTSLVGYDATTSDAAWGQAMGSIGQEALASAAGDLSKVAVSDLISGLASYFGSGAGSASTNTSAWSGMVSNLAQSEVSGAISGAGSSNSMGSAGGIGLGSVTSMMGTGGSLAAPSAGGSGLTGAMGAPSGASNVVVQPAAGSAATGALPGATH